MLLFYCLGEKDKVFQKLMLVSGIMYSSFLQIHLNFTSFSSIISQVRFAIIKIGNKIFLFINYLFKFIVLFSVYLYATTSLPSSSFLLVPYLQILYSFYNQRCSFPVNWLMILHAPACNCALC
jgi:hypothetical protein